MEIHQAHIRLIKDVMHPNIGLLSRAPWIVQQLGKQVRIWYGRDKVEAEIALLRQSVHNLQTRFQVRNRSLSVISNDHLSIADTVDVEYVPRYKHH